MAKKIYTKLPSSLQTTAIKNFFEGTVEQLFSKANVDQIQGFIGTKQSEDVNLLNGTFIQEPTYTKQAYALSPAVNTINETTGKSDNLIFYDELIDTLKTYGVDVSNHNKIFSESYASFLPPINIDKFVNYQEYYWYPRGPSAIVIEPTRDNFIDVDRDIIGKKSYTPASGKKFRNGMVVMFKGNFVSKADGFYTTKSVIDTADMIAGNSYKIHTLGSTDWNSVGSFPSGAKSLELFTATASHAGTGKVMPVTYEEYVVTGVGENIKLIKKNNNYNARYTTTDFNSNSIDFVYKNKSIVTAVPTYTAAQQPADFDDVGLPTVYIKGEQSPGETAEIQNVVVGTLAQYSGDTVISDGTNSVTLDHSVSQPRTVVELVEQIQSAPGYSNLDFTVEVATRMPTDYILQERGAHNNNHWSRINFWFHRENFIDAGDSFPGIDFRAKRPIIEFDNTIELYNYGERTKGDLDADAFNISYEAVDGLSTDQFIDNVIVDSYEKIIFSNETTDVSQYFYSAKKVTADEYVKAVLIDDGVSTELDTTITLDGQGRKSVITGIALNTPVVVNDTANAVVEIQGIRSLDASINISIDNTDTLTGIAVINGGKGWYQSNQRRVLQLTDIEQTTIQSLPGDATFIALKAQVGDTVYVKTGESQVGKALTWNGATWEESQEKSLPNQAPLFKLYDTNGVYLGDESVYPNNTFSGNKIFGYATEVDENDSNVVRSTQIDDELGTKLIYKLFNAQSEIVFENFIETQTYTFTPAGTTAQVGITDGASNLNGPYAINGFYPLYSDQQLAESAGNGTAHEHVFFGKIFYMPNGLEMGVTQFHGNYSGQLSPISTEINTTTNAVPATVSTTQPVATQQPPSSNSPSSGGSSY